SCRFQSSGVSFARSAKATSGGVNRRTASADLAAGSESVLREFPKSQELANGHAGLFRVSDVLFVRALKVFDAAVLEMPDPRGYFIDQIVIVGYQEHGTFELLQRYVQRVDRFQV